VGCLFWLRLADEYLTDFLYSFRAVISPEKLFDKLVEYFFFLPPNDATSEVIEYQEERVSGSIQVRQGVPDTLRVIKRWITLCYFDFCEPDLSQRLLKFINQSIPQCVDSGSSWSIILKAIMAVKAARFTAVTFRIQTLQPSVSTRTCMKLKACGGRTGPCRFESLRRRASITTAR
jgi:hypothetical protein